MSNYMDQFLANALVTSDKSREIFGADVIDQIALASPPGRNWTEIGGVTMITYTGARLAAAVRGACPPTTS